QPHHRRARRGRRRPAGAGRRAEDRAGAGVHPAAAEPDRAVPQRRVRTGGIVTTSRVIGLVAGREFTTRVRSKSFLVSTVVILAVLAAYALLFTFIAKQSSAKIGLTGQATAMSAPL